ncbi:NADH dehydrogenase subunit 6 (mitochondrion) [Cephus cinctus]|uniref:NADH-ubiquinone oxidoreductase chain 6 n=1 Tax=Cephus cinctus TaxID=211228 RepID=C4NCE0_CEPCN|nr:NADH dehydrogenase subunit 6 [Cephus cinctus]ACJ69691.1 NADH dehydrogenase subunit 6 [Cephus cinctus]
MSMYLYSNFLNFKEMSFNFLLILSSIMLILLILMIKSIHPIEMMIYLIMFSIIMCLKTSLLYKNFWFSYMLFLTMIGGILVLFLYFVSTASNEKYQLNDNLNIKFLTIMISISFILMFIMYVFDYFSINMIELNMNHNLIIKMNNWSNSNSYNMHQMFNNNYKVTLMTMIYLLFTLFSVMKMCMKMYGPLRQHI